MKGNETAQIGELRKARTTLVEKSKAERLLGRRRGRWGKKKKLRGLSPQANYTDRATAAVGEECRLLRVEGVTWSAQRIPTAVNLGFLDRRENNMQL
jgi:hypothetical protein